MEILDAPSFLWMVHDIFDERMYAFPAVGDSPLIIDGGANIGVSVAFFKREYPRSRIVAFEPDPEVYATLERNVRRLGPSDVTLHCCALWIDDRELPFLATGADSGRLVRGGDHPTTTVRAVRLRDYLDQPVELLKLDVEGAETRILADCADRLENVKHLFVEYHSFGDEPQSLPELLQILAGAGFRLHLLHQAASPRPFLGLPSTMGMDLQLKVFAFRQ